MSRLPVPGSDDNAWGDILNDFLGVSHNTDGTIKTGVVGTTQIADNAITSAKIADGTITTADISTTAGIVKTQLSSAVQASLSSADTALQSIPSASSSFVGGVRLAGDLGGTASAPTTPTAVHLTGAETVAGVKTFTSSPVVPVPVGSGDAANKSYVDTALATASTTTYTTSNTSSSFVNNWTRFASITIGSQFGDSSVVVQFVSGGDVLTLADTARVTIRSKQQAAFGSNPYVSVALEQSTTLTPANFAAVITQNTPSSTVDFYMQITQLSRNYVFVPVIYESQSNVTMINSDSFVASLPAGLGQVSAVRTGPPPITVGYTAPSTPAFGDIWIDMN